MIGNKKREGLRLKTRGFMTFKKTRGLWLKNKNRGWQKTKKVAKP